MDAIIWIIIMKELWEKINIVSIIGMLGLLGGMIGTIVAAYITWRTDRPRLDKLEKDRDKMKTDFEEHQKDNIQSFEEIRNNMNSSNQKVVDKIDELKMFLLHSKITLKGEEYESDNDKRV